MTDRYRETGDRNFLIVRDHVDGDSFQERIQKKKKLADGSYQPISISSQESMIQSKKPK